MEEKWKDIPGYEESYQVSDLGRVRSLDRVIEFERNGVQLTQKWKGKVRALTPDSRGYLSVNLGKTRCIHHLVLLTFVGPRPEDLVTRHLNGNQRDNRLSNLKYDTHAENMRDIARHGRTKLSIEEIHYIRACGDFGPRGTHTKLAKKLKISRRHISAIIDRKSYNYV